MVGVIPGDTVMHARPQGRGYVRLATAPDHPWRMADGNEAEICAHEFHYSSLENLQAPTRFAFEVLRGAGIDGSHDGYVYKNLLACYTHQRTTSSNRWTEHFLKFVAACKTRRASTLTGQSTQQG
jgi:cobyrinic acid a,c-diamide synthase